MDVSFNTQPFDDGRDLRDFLASVAADDSLGDLDVVVAWAKRSGLALVRGDLETIRALPLGTTRLIVGIDEGGATREGLQMARDIFDSVYVFHENTWRTFHPKVFIASGPERARLLVGSNNLTAGGVFYNYEAALEVGLDLTLPDDRALLQQVADYVERLLTDDDVCLELDDDLYAELIANPRYRVDTEATAPPIAEAEDLGDLPENVDTPSATPVDEAHPPSVFGPSGTAKRSRPPLPKKVATKKLAAKKAATPPPGPPPTPPPPAPPQPVATVVRRWTKTELANSDAQQKGTENTQITGNLKLTQAGHPINHQVYFRQQFFGDADWTSEQRDRGELETAEVEVEVFVDGNSVGVFEMTVDHADYRIADQSNVPTWLKWKDFGEYLQQHDQRRKTVSLERLSDGRFRAHFAADATGAFA